ncbi:cadherin-17 [Pelobates fuscus]|uniref:cadherin-17 n=1 Tax=Pelobates fuscus TaxID=191477 RepID=UPI002FE45BBA
MRQVKMIRHLVIFQFLIQIQALVNGQPNGPLMDRVIRTLEGPATTLFQFDATNPNSVSFALEGEVEGIFEILNQGLLRSTKPLDRETKALYKLKVKTLNAAGHLVEGPFSVDIIVEDINDNLPAFNQTEYSGEIREQSRPGKQIVTVYATDADDPETPNGQLVYKITHQIPDPYKVMLFQINNKTGTISTTLNGSVLLKKETHDQYELLVIASDVSFSDNVKVIIKVTENIWKTPKPVTIVENSTEPHPMKITQVQWNDDSAIYELQQRERYPKFPFSIDKDGNINVTEPLDREERAQYIFYAAALNENRVRLALPVEIEVNVEDINDNPPVCPSHVTNFEVQENEGLGESIGTLTATDIDEESSRNSLLRYRLVSQYPKIPEDGMFRLDQYTGVFQIIKNGLNINDVDLYVLRVNVSDEGVNPSALSTLCEVHIKVIDINDQIPIFEKSDYGNLTLSEDTPMQARVFEIQAFDGDQPFTGSSEIIYVIAEGDPLKTFAIDTDKKTNIGSLKIVHPLDYESKAEYNLVIHAINPEPLFSGVSYNDSSITRLKIIVTNIDESPYFEETIYQTQIKEDVPFGTLLTKIVAIDPEGDDVIYVLNGDRRKWLWINETTGEIYTNAILDRETEPHYYVEVTAKERRNPSMKSSVSFQLFLDDVNDNAPKLANGYAGAVFCHPLSNKESVFVEAVDADTSPNSRRFRFTLGVGENITRDWTLSFINGSHTKLNMKHHDFPTGIIRVPIIVNDNGKPPLESTVYASVTICTCSSDNKCSSPPLDDFGRPSVGMALGILFGVLAVIGIIVAAVFISINKKKKNTPKKVDKVDATSPTETITLAS